MVANGTVRSATATATALTTTSTRATATTRIRRGEYPPAARDYRVRLLRRACVSFLHGHPCTPTRGSACHHASDARCNEAISATPAPLGRRLGVVHTPRDLSAQWGAKRPVAAEAEPMGHDAPHNDGSPFRQGAQRDPRLLRGRPKPRDHGDERLGRARASLVAQPAGASRRESGVTRWLARDPGPRGQGGRARAPLGTVARDGRRSRWLRDPPPVWDRGRRPRAAAGFDVTF